jgi:hypothetical protein
MIRSFGGLEDEEVEEGRGMMARLAGRCRLGRGGIRLGRGGSRGLGVGLVGILSSCLGKEGMDGYGLLSGMGWCEVLAFRLTVGVDGGGDGCPLRNLEEADDGTQTVDSRLGMQWPLRSAVRIWYSSTHDNNEAATVVFPSLRG